MNNVKLNNTGRDSIPNLYFPRLQVNKGGEIVLATGKEGILTSGVLVAKTPESKSTLSIGQKCTDWEVFGELTDYDGEITVKFQNEVTK